MTDLVSFKNIPDGNTQYTMEFSQAHGALVVEYLPDEVVVGLCDITNQVLKDQLTAYHDTQSGHKVVRFIEIDRKELMSFLGRSLGKNYSQEIQSTKKINADEDLDRIANDSPIINLVNSILLQAYKDNASDIHIEAQEDKAVVRFRLDGELQVVQEFNSQQFPGVSSRLKILAQLNILEKRLPQDGRISLHLDKYTVDVRISIIPTITGESIVLRILQHDSNFKTLEELGFSQDSANNIRSILGSPHGLILVTGPTGSGKSTTLHSFVKALPLNSLKIITLEDPVEYQLRGVNQVQINEAIGLTFDSSLRRVLRQDPDVILVGEIRDQITAQLAVRAALTGHLVLATLHTNTALASIPRLIDIGVEPFLLKAVLHLAIAQRLVRCLCPNCRVGPDAVNTQDKLYIDSLNLSIDKVFRPRGCSQCKNTGYRGRTLIFEELLPRCFSMLSTEDYLNYEKIELNAYANGFKPMKYSAENLVVNGITTLDEVIKALFI